MEAADAICACKEDDQYKLRRMAYDRLTCLDDTRCADDVTQYFLRDELKEDCMSDPNNGYYVVSVVLDNGLAGGPVLHLDLGVDASTGQVSGRGEITQAIAPPLGETMIPHVSGRIEYVGTPTAEMLVSLTGRYGIPFGPPPMIGHVEALLKTAFVVDREWKGKGSFGYGPNAEHNVRKCAVRKAATKQDQPIISAQPATV
jgi:hypothetical protein